MVRTAQISEFERLLNKAPVPTLYFWIITLVLGVIGETSDGFFSTDRGLGVSPAAWIALGLLAVTLFVQLAARSYRPWLYWSTILMASLVATRLTETLTEWASVPLFTSAAVFGWMIVASLTLWHRLEGSVAVDNVYSTRRELFYWATMLAIFAFGTALGDGLSVVFGLGDATLVAIFAVLIVAVAAGRLSGRLGAQSTFWLAYVLVQLLGASVGDILTASASSLDWSLPAINTACLAAIVALVAFLNWSGLDQPVLMRRMVSRDADRLGPAGRKSRP